MSEGPQGEQGERGPRGEHGAHFESRVVFAFVALVLIATLVTGVQGYALKELEKRQAESAEAHDALCAFKHNLEARTADTQTFLDEVQSGARPPIVGISENDLQRSLDGQKQTLQSLRTLNCE